MFEDPFFGDHLSRRPPSFATCTPSSPQPRKNVKVVSIPVHHVDSSQTRSDAATKIQKTFRGFRVRKTIKKILEIKREVDDVEKKLLEGETMAVIRKNSLERLKVTETLMALLFKLDSIRGINGGVREFRKAVITKAIMLQEIVDAAINDDDDEVRKVVDKEKEKIVDECCGKLGNCGGIDECVDKLTENLDDLGKLSEKFGDETLGKVDDNEMESLDDLSKISADNSENFGGETLGEDAGDDNEMNSFDDSSKMQVENSNSEKICNENLENVEGIVDADDAHNCSEMQVEFLGDNTESWECVVDGTEEQKSDFVEVPEVVDNGGAENREGGRKRSSNEEWFVVGGGNSREEEKDKKEKLLEKMAEDNQRLMAMVADLCQKNAMQTRLICSLSQRVEQLEKAMSDRLRKKKKKCNASLT